jgi:steroid 5-alpha reductase family enzyme
VTGLGVTLAATAGATVILMAAAFGAGLVIRKHSVADIAWGLGIAMIAVVALLTSPGHGQGARRVLLVTAAVAWGVRLGAFVGWRNRGQPEDPRYSDLLARAPASRNGYALRVVYLLQAAALWFASLPVQAGMFAAGPVNALTVAGVVLWLAGFGFESAGDWQLARFTADPVNAGQIMDRGLWRYTRHPNYFGDACMWWGMFGISCGAWPMFGTIFSPLLMTYVLIGGTGKRLTEQRMSRSRPGYAEYAARTSGFFPLPPRR